MATTITYRRIQHAGHYAAGAGHDLESWDVTGDVERSSRTGDPMPPLGVPLDATYHSGHVDDGVQHWTFTRRAPLTGTCPRCSPVAA